MRERIKTKQKEWKTKSYQMERLFKIEDYPYNIYIGVQGDQVNYSTVGLSMKELEIFGGVDIKTDYAPIYYISDTLLNGDDAYLERLLNGINNSWVGGPGTFCFKYNPKMTIDKIDIENIILYRDDCQSVISFYKKEDGTYVEEYRDGSDDKKDFNIKYLDDDIEVISTLSDSIEFGYDMYIVCRVK